MTAATATRFDIQDPAIRAQLARLKDSNATFVIILAANGGWTTVATLDNGEERKVRNGALEALRGNELADQHFPIIEAAAAPTAKKARKAKRVAVPAAQFTEQARELMANRPLADVYGLVADALSSPRLIGMKQWGEFEPNNALVNRDILKARYGHLNNGQQRMLIGLLLRSVMRDTA